LWFTFGNHGKIGYACWPCSRRDGITTLYMNENNCRKTGNFVRFSMRQGGYCVCLIVNENILPIPLVPHYLRVRLYVEELKRPLTSSTLTSVVLFRASSPHHQIKYPLGGDCTLSIGIASCTETVALSNQDQLRFRMSDMRWV